MNPIVFPFNQATRPHFAEFVFYEGFFNPQEVERIRNLWDSEKEVDATLSGGGKETDEALRKTKLTFIQDSPDNIWLYKKLGQLGIQYNHERYGYDLLT